MTRYDFLWARRVILSNANSFKWLQLQVLKYNRLAIYVDSSHPRYSNWLRYVNAARHISEQNVMAQLCDGRVYYRTSRDMAPGTELLMDYGHRSRRKLGIDPSRYFVN